MSMSTVRQIKIFKLINKWLSNCMLIFCIRIERTHIAEKWPRENHWNANIMKEKYINLILSNVSQRSHCLVLKNILALNMFMSTEQISHLLEIMGNFCRTCILSTVQNVYIYKETNYFTIFSATLLCLYAEQFKCSCCCLYAKIYLGRKRCTKGDLCKFFIVLWYTEIFLNAYLND